MPNPITLCPAANGYRRRLYEGRTVSVYYDCHPGNEWHEHTREEDEVSALLGDAVGILKWQPPDGAARELRIQGPAAWVIPAGTPHALICPGESEMVTLFMDRAFAAEINGSKFSDVAVKAFAHLIGRDALIGQLATTFRSLCHAPGTANAIYIEAIGTVFASHLLRGLLAGNRPPDRTSGLPDEALQRVIRYIDKHTGDSLDLATLGRAAGFSSSHFGRLFKTSVNMTPHEYVMRRRVAKAAELLERTDKKEVEIALLCGFSDDTLMARWFRRVLGCRPSEVRAQRPR